MAAFLDRRRGLVELCLAFTSLWHICLASPLQIKRPGWSNNFNDLQLLKRSTSSDASCPAGWLCEQQNCPANVICPTGEICVDFEGTPACAPSGTSWCALNPNTLQAVKCVNGICWYVKTSRQLMLSRQKGRLGCFMRFYVFNLTLYLYFSHGNCYAADAVCCDNNAVQCTIGHLCNVCEPGQTCTTGTSTCAVGGGSSTTTKSSVSTSHPSSTATSPPSSITTTVSSMLTQSSRTPSSPTEVAQVGDFVDVGCFQDSSDSRILVGDSTEDQSSTGMTVEKCVAFALQNNWQYAGVEFGGYVDYTPFPYMILLPLFSLKGWY
jgi:hypothetical protein